MLGLNDLFDWDYRSKSKIICRSASGIVMTFKKSFILLTIFKDPETVYNSFLDVDFVFHVL